MSELRVWILVFGVFGACSVLVAGWWQASGNGASRPAMAWGLSRAPLMLSENTSNPADDITHVLRDMEQQVFVLINDARTDPSFVALSGRTALLIWDEDLGTVARGHSLDMVNRSFFQHESPDGQTPADRIRQAGIKATASGENIAKATDVASAHASLMASPGHRRNIMASEFTHVGIGIAEDDTGMLVVTELFRRAPATELAREAP